MSNKFRTETIVPDTDRPYNSGKITLQYGLIEHQTEPSSKRFVFGARDDASSDSKTRNFEKKV